MSRSRTLPLNCDKFLFALKKVTAGRTECSGSLFCLTTAGGTKTTSVFVETDVVLSDDISKVQVKVVL